MISFLQGSTRCREHQTRVGMAQSVVPGGRNIKPCRMVNELSGKPFTQGYAKVLFEVRGTHFFFRGVRKKGTQIVRKLRTLGGNSFTSTFRRTSATTACCFRQTAVKYISSYSLFV